MRIGSNSIRTSAASFFLKNSLLLALLAGGGVAAAQSIAARLPISLDADSSSFDRRNDRIEFRGLRITQGAIGIEADEGVTTVTPGTNLDIGNSVWAFDGNVRIDIETAKIRSDRAELHFRDHRLEKAIVTGSPARFNDRGRASELPVVAEARAFEYDLSSSIVRFSGDARIAEGTSNEITGAELTYDLKAQRVDFEGDSSNGERVSITIVPEDIADDSRPESDATR